MVSGLPAEDVGAPSPVQSKIKQRRDESSLSETRQSLSDTIWYFTGV